MLRMIILQKKNISKSLLNFKDKVENFYLKKNFNLKKINKLTDLRDTLIEKILSERI